MRRALAAHESLRTKLQRTPRGELQQILHSDMRLPIHIVEACDAATVRRYKEALRERLLRKPFDFAGEWPIRVGAISRDGLIRYVLIVVSHHAIDHRAIPLLEKHSGMMHPSGGKAFSRWTKLLIRRRWRGSGSRRLPRTIGAGHFATPH
jgi:hypothetical protein